MGGKKDCSDFRLLNMEWGKGLRCQINANMWPNGQKVNYIKATTEIAFTVIATHTQRGKDWAQ